MLRGQKGTHDSVPFWASGSWKKAWQSGLTQSGVTSLNSLLGKCIASSALSEIWNSTQTHAISRTKMNFPFAFPTITVSPPSSLNISCPSSPKWNHKYVMNSAYFSLRIYRTTDSPDITATCNNLRLYPQPPPNIYMPNWKWIFNFSVSGLQNVRFRYDSRGRREGFRLCGNSLVWFILRCHGWQFNVRNGPCPGNTNIISNSTWHRPTDRREWVHTLQF